MRKLLRWVALHSLKNSGVFALARRSEWRRQRLLILCYHGISLQDEHEWRPALYLTAQKLERRFEILKRNECNVLSLNEALHRLYMKELPPRSVAITFDDGNYDFYRNAYPILNRYNFPATVYLTTYYSNYQRPIFNLVCPYMMWKARNQGNVDLKEFGLYRPVALASAEARLEATTHLLNWAREKHLTGEEKDQIAVALSRRLQIDYEEISSKRMLQLMNRQEVRKLADAGIDFQLHTHRHRTPVNEELFRLEIRENRNWILDAAGTTGSHFCYPSGVYRHEFLPWLSAENIISATTCDTGLATARSNPLLLPRLVDTPGRTDLEFESWVNGVGQFLSRRKPVGSFYPIE